MKSDVLENLWDGIAAKALSGGLTIAKKIADDFANHLALSADTIKRRGYHNDFVFDIEQFTEPIQQFLSKVGVGNSHLSCGYSDFKSNFYLRVTLLKCVADLFLKLGGPGVSAYATQSIKVANTTIYSFSFGSEFVGEMFTEFAKNPGDRVIEVSPKTEAFIRATKDSFVVDSESFLMSSVSITDKILPYKVTYSLPTLTLLSSLINLLEAAVLRKAFESSLATCNSMLIIKSSNDTTLYESQGCVSRSMWRLMIDSKNRISWNRYLDNGYATHECDAEVQLPPNIRFENMLPIQYIAG